MILLWCVVVLCAVYLAGASVYAAVLVVRFGPMIRNPIVVATIARESLRWPDVVLNRLFP